VSLTASIVDAHRAATEGRIYGSGPGTTNCVVAVEDVLAAVYGVRVRQEHAALMVMDRRRPWSVIEAVERLGIGIEVDDSPTAGRWHVCQGWRTLIGGEVPPDGPSINGHAWLWWEPSRVGAGRILEANVRHPWDRVRTWGEQRAPYRAGVRLAVLSDPFSAAPYVEPLSRPDVELG